MELNMEGVCRYADDDGLSFAFDFVSCDEGPTDTRLEGSSGRLVDRSVRLSSKGRITSDGNISCGIVPLLSTFQSVERLQSVVVVVGQVLVQPVRRWKPRVAPPAGAPRISGSGSSRAIGCLDSNIEHPCYSRASLDLLTPTLPAFFAPDCLTDQGPGSADAGRPAGGATTDAAAREHDRRWREFEALLDDERSGGRSSGEQSRW